LSAVDTNVLVYAADEEAPERAACRAVLERLRSGDETWYLTWSVVYEFLVVTTRRGLSRRPRAPEESMAFIDALQRSPSLQMLEHGPQHLAALGELLRAGPSVRGSDLHDGHIVALMREHGVRTIYTRDAAFLRFPDIEAIDPLRT
jgi:toxin-antitoxin system PIN domain toxin